MSHLQGPMLELAQTRTRKGLRVLLRNSIIGLIATAASLLVSQGSVSAVGWGSFISLVRGFPIPYVTYNQCNSPSCDFQGLVFNPLTGFHVLYAFANFGVWFVISTGILLFVSSVRGKRTEILASIGAVSGLGITLLTFFLQPISLAYPMFSTEFFLSHVGGFPWEYFTKGTFELPLSPPLTGSSFSTMNFVADYALWSLVILSLIGFSALVFSRVPHSRDSHTNNSS